jgi:hypothetical protein
MKTNVKLGIALVAVLGLLYVSRKKQAAAKDEIVKEIAKEAVQATSGYFTVSRY